MKANLFEFHITNFEEVYAIIDDEKQRLHISAVNYQYNISLDLTKNLSYQLEEQTKYGEINFNATVRQVVSFILEKLFKVCSSCSKKVYEGFINKQNDSIYCSKECLLKTMTEKEFEKLYDNWECYWTDF